MFVCVRVPVGLRACERYECCGHACTYTYYLHSLNTIRQESWRRFLGTRRSRSLSPSMDARALRLVPSNWARTSPSDSSETPFLALETTSTPASAEERTSSAPLKGEERAMRCTRASVSG